MNFYSSPKGVKKVTNPHKAIITPNILSIEGNVVTNRNKPTIIAIRPIECTNNLT